MIDSDDSLDDDFEIISDIAKNKGITILHWNCRSMFSKLLEITHMVKSSDGECCFFTESWLTSAISDGMIDIP